MNITFLRQSKQLRMCTKSAPSIITKAVTHFSSSWSHDVPLISSLHNESLIYILSARCYNERIHKLAELRTWQKLAVLSGEWTFDALHNTNTYWCICQICFANIRRGPLIPRGPKGSAYLAYWLSPPLIITSIPIYPVSKLISNI